MHIKISINARREKGGNCEENASCFACSIISLLYFCWFIKYKIKIEILKGHDQVVHK